MQISATWAGNVLNFVLGLIVGLLAGLRLWSWQRSRSESRLRAMVKTLDADVAGTPLSSVSQLSIAIAHQQKFQHQLEQEIASHKQILQIAPLGYLQVDDENRLLWCNLQACKLLEMSQDQGQAQPRLLLEVVRSYELDELIDATRAAGQPRQSDWTFHPVNPDPANLSKQSPYALRGHAFPLSDEQVGVFLENRQEAENLRQQRDRWASDLAHELKTPLTSIRLVAETLQMRLDPALQVWCDRLINETMRLSSLVQDLLDLTQLERDAVHQLRLESLDLVPLIHSVWSNLEPLARSKNLRLDYDGLPHLEVVVDRARIYRLLINLLDNSIKYSPANYPIWLRLHGAESATEQNLSAGSDRPVHANQGQLGNSGQLENSGQPGQIHLEVIDYGTGFAEKDLPYVFERFYRADLSRTRLLNPESAGEMSLLSPDRLPTPTTPQSAGQSRQSIDRPFDPISQTVARAVSMGTSQNGSGLGLAIVRQIVEAHGGWVTASNHPETGGAWLQVFLPIAPEDRSRGF